MKMVLEIPDDVAESLGGSCGALTRTALEALAVEGYRGGALSTKQVRSLLGHASRWDFSPPMAFGRESRLRRPPRTAAP